MLIEFKDETLINAWLERSSELSAEAAQAMADTSQLVVDITNESNGTLVDEMVEISNKVLTMTKELTNTMEEISSTIHDVIHKVAGFVDSVGGFLSNISKAL